jgi:hypothetical protein
MAMNGHWENHMGSHHELAQLLVAIWSVSGSERRIPTSHGVLDRALKTVADQGLFPSWAREHLHFTDSRVGLQCVELPSILDWAQVADLTSAPNPSYRYTEIRVSSRVARKLLKDLHLSEEEAQQLGRALRKSIEEVLRQQSVVDTAGIEAY